MKWTQEEIEIIQKLHDKGRTIREMCTVLPYRSKYSVKHALDQLDLVPNMEPRPVDLDAYQKLMREEPIDA